MTSDELFMSHAIELAQLADASVFPNPFVGAVIVLNEEIIAAGFHQKYGEAHAEVNAVSQVSDKSMLKDCTIYVTLEPCAHYGKTPPCSDLLVKHQFKRVVIGSVDPFALVNGAGVERLKNAGIEVETGVLKNECDALNKRFFTFHQKKRPYITLKWAESQDGFVAPLNQEIGNRTKITGTLAHLLVHQQRSQEHAILVGRRTVEQDNPSLNVRHIDAPSPIRFVLDPQLQLHKNLNIFEDGAPTHVMNLIQEEEQQGAVHYHKMADLSPEAICDKLFELGILSVYVEGGVFTIQQFIDAGLWDEAFRFVGENNLGNGIIAPKVNGKLADRFVVERDMVEVYKTL